MWISYFSHRLCSDFFAHIKRKCRKGLLPSPAGYFWCMEIGLYTFGDVGTHPITRQTVDAHQRLHNLLEEAQLADELGLDVFAVGEHHREDYSVSSPAVVLAAIACQTKKIKLSSAVTVLSSDDPVRVFQQFATVDLLSNGRAEIMAGRGSFIESYPLFGYQLEDYDELFAEKLEMLLKLNESELISWTGKHTQSISNRGVYPRPLAGKLPIWVAVGGTPQSVVRAAQLGLPLAIAIIGGQPAQFQPLVRLYKEVYQKSGHDVAAMQLSINSIGFVGDEAKAARDEFYPPYAESMARIGRERGWPPGSRAQYEATASPRGALVLGDVNEVAEKILYEHELFGNTRFLLQMSMGAVPHKAILRAIELMGTKVAPQVRKHLQQQDSAVSTKSSSSN